MLELVGFMMSPVWNLQVTYQIKFCVDSRILTPNAWIIFYNNSIKFNKDSFLSKKKPNNIDELNNKHGSIVSVWLELDNSGKDVGNFYKDLLHFSCFPRDKKTYFPIMLSHFTNITFAQQ